MSDGSVQIGLRRPMRSLEIAASGLSAQRTRMDTIAMNIANAESIGADGAPYRRRVVRLEPVPFRPLLEGGPAEPVDAGDEGAGGVRVAGIEEDPSEGQLIYDPSHPDADADGYVHMPNVSITEEMVDLMEARRLFDANASVFEAIKGMLRRATQL